jgi:hypothetical protein
MDNYLLALKAYQKVLKAYGRYLDEHTEYAEALNNLGVQTVGAEGPGTLPPPPPPPPPPHG